MAQKRATLGDIRGVVTAYFNNKKIADPSWTPSEESISGLINTIMKIYVIDGMFADKLPELSGDFLPFGQAIEEYYTGLVPVLDFNDNENNNSSAEAALKPYRPTFDQVVFSERLGRKKFKTTVDYNRYEVSLHDQGELESLLSLVMKRLYDSKAQWIYNVKKNLLGTFANKAIAANAGTAYITNSTVIKVGVIYVQSNKFYIAKRNFAAAVNKSLADLAGNDADYPYSVIEITPSMVAELAKPVDESTGEAFIKAVKNAVEDAGFVTEGTSLSGSTIGAEDGLKLYIKKGIMSSVEVDTLAGAFHAEKLAVPCEIKVIEDFGPDVNSKVWGMLIDPRGVKLHNNYAAAREDINGDGDYVTYTLHDEETAYISNHVFIKVLMTE